MVNKGWLGEEELANYQAWEKKWGSGTTALKELLSPEEFAAAQRSTINAHYTSREVISGMWEAVRAMGFTGGAVLENSAGVGHFIGLQPADLAKRPPGRPWSWTR